MIKKFRQFINEVKRSEDIELRDYYINQAKKEGFGVSPGDYDGAIKKMEKSTKGTVGIAFIGDGVIADYFELTRDFANGISSSFIKSKVVIDKTFYFSDMNDMDDVGRFVHGVVGELKGVDINNFDELLDFMKDLGEKYCDEYYTPLVLFIDGEPIIKADSEFAYEYQ